MAESGWEHAAIEIGSGRAQELVPLLNDGGAKGWEVVSITSNERALGERTLVALVKRPLAPLPRPEDTNAGWKGDPSGRHTLRYWDGEYWTFWVDDNGDETRDPPTMLTPAVDLKQ